jgi:ATP-dependent protease ClpP protease subunit
MSIAVAVIDRELNQPMVDNLDLLLRRCEPGERRSFVLCINSEGGSTMLGERMYDRLRKAISEERIRLTTFNTGKTDSAAVSVFCAGEERIAAPDSAFLLHRAGFIQIEGEPQEGMHERIAEAQRIGTESMARVLGKAIGGDWMATLLQENRWTAAEALRLGIVTRIGTAPFGGAVENIELNRLSREWSEEEYAWLARG